MAYKILQVGLGGLGSTLALELTQMAGLDITFIDYDVVDISNLHRQYLFDESDIGKTKAQAANDHLAKTTTKSQFRTSEEQITLQNAQELISGNDLIIDAVDGYRTKFMLNDICVRLDVPLIYGAAIGWEGRAMAIQREGACLRCLFPDEPDENDCPQPEKTGVMGPVPAAVAMQMSLMAKKMSVANKKDIGWFHQYDFKDNTFRKLHFSVNPECPLHSEIREQ